jgi:hypothetical protein
VLSYSATSGPWLYRKPSVARCPFCEGVLITNLHPKEQQLFGWAAAGLIAVIATAFVAGTIAALIVAAAFIAGVGAAVAYIHWKYLDGWPRYVADVALDSAQCK